VSSSLNAPVALCHDGHLEDILASCSFSVIFANYLSVLGQSEVRFLLTTTVCEPILNFHILPTIPPTSAPISRRNKQTQHAYISSQENVKRLCSRTSDASNPIAGLTTPNAGTSPNHTYHAVWIGTYTKLSFSQVVLHAFLLHTLQHIFSRSPFQSKRGRRYRPSYHQIIPIAAGKSRIHSLSSCMSLCI
jgi:hypothetical protein